MTAEAIPLRFASARVARLRELTGRDERGVSGVSTADAIRLLDALYEGASAQPADRFTAADLVAADRDRLLAAVYRRAFGDRIESTLTCARCAKPFDLHFSLTQLDASLNRGGGAAEWHALGNARFETNGGMRFRLPTGEDELAAANLGEQEAESLLLSRCAESGRWPGGASVFQDMLDQLAPLLDLELNAPCPECGYSHTVQFDIQGYLLNAISSERPRLMREIHLLAATYGWSLEAILSLNRSERRQLVELIQNEIPTRPARR